MLARFISVFLNVKTNICLSQRSIFRISQVMTRNFTSANFSEDEEMPKMIREKVDLPKKKYEGGDYNTVTLLGTVSDVKIFPKKKDVTHDWGRIFMNTQSIGIRHDTEGEELTEEPVVYTSSHRVHVFHPRLLHTVHRLTPGQRLFITGFISYYKVNVDEYYNRSLVVVANKLIPMGSSYDPTRTEIDNLVEEPEEHTIFTSDEQEQNN